MKTMRIIFVRHADHVNNKLTKIGRQQAKLVCHELGYENIGRVFCSPCGRAVETARVICNELGLGAPIIVEDLKEREGLVGKPETKEQVDFADNYLNPNFSMEHPEGCKEFVERSFRFLDKVVQEDFESILIVGHSSFSYVMTAYFTGLPKDKNLAWVRIGNCSKLCFEVNKA